MLTRLALVVAVIALVWLLASALYCRCDECEGKQEAT
jgi:hypothetical protein